MNQLSGSVIIPAHNEASVIENTLDALTKSVSGINVEVIVVCNGCTDDTAERARRFAPHVQVVETEIGSKVLALNLGDQHATWFPRLYLDADIEVSSTMMREMLTALAGDQPRAAWPSVKYDTSQSSWIVKAFYYVWTRMPYNRPGRIGVGIYGMNESARNRFDEFPTVISDDGFVRGMFGESERVILDSCHTLVHAPLTATSMIKIRTRSRLGVYELRAKHSKLIEQHHADDSKWSTLAVILRPDVLLRFPVYLICNLIVRARARKQYANLANYNWERDESSRVAAS